MRSRGHPEGRHVPSSRPVLVYGEALIDIVTTDGRTSQEPGGSPANVALGLGRLGVDVTLLTSIGEDDFGRRIRDHLTASNVTVHPESFTEGPTSTATALIAPDGGAEYDFDIRWTPTSLSPAVRPRLLHTGSIAAFLEPGAGKVLEAMRQLQGLEITFDPNIRPALLKDRGVAIRRFEMAAALATVVKLSQEDASWLYPGHDTEQVIDHLLAIGPRFVVVTLGAEGAQLSTLSHSEHIPGVPVDVVDTIGAGDTFMASIIASLLERPSTMISSDDLQSIGTRAVKASAITVTRRGADLPNRTDVLKGRPMLRQGMAGTWC